MHLVIPAGIFMLLSSLVFAQVIEVPEAQIPFTPADKPLQGLIITLDAGHGGSAHTGGYAGSARGVNSKVIEENLNILVAAELRHHLVDAGATVYMTRWDDRKVSLGETDRATELGSRVKMAEETHSHLFLSLHHNSAPRKTANGVMILAWPIDSKDKPQPLEEAFAAIMREEVEKTIHHQEKFDTWKDKHPLVSFSDIPSVTVEFGFMSNPEFDAWVIQKGSHRQEAIGAYNGVVRMWKEHKDELEALRLKLFPELKKEKKTKPVVNPVVIPGMHPQLPQLCAELWPYAKGPKTLADLQIILANYSSNILVDRTFFYLRTKLEKKGSYYVLTGSTNLPELRNTVEYILRYFGIQQIRNQIELLPSQRLGEQPYGIISIPMSLCWGSPKENASVQTQLLMGEHLVLLDVSTDTSYYLAHGGDGYIGWIRKDAITLMNQEQFMSWETSHQAIFTKDYLLQDLRFYPGSSLPIVSYTDTSVTLRLPRGFRATNQAPEVTIPREYLRLPAATSSGRLAALTAVDYLTTPYVFGGKSKLGIDCSGLTQVAYASVGLTIPRDARQQIIMGQLVATPWHLNNLQPGDLLFFVDDLGRVIHAGVSLGGMKFIHASPPEVQVNSFDPLDPLYSKTWHSHFAFARRFFTE